MQTTQAERMAGRIRAVSLPLGWTTAAPLLCAVHCAATPVLIVIAPALAKNAMLEIWLLGVSVVLAAGALAIGTRSHGRGVVWIPVALGLSLWAASLTGWLDPLPEAWTLPVASLTVAGGLIWNSRVLSVSRGHACPCPVCPPDASGER